jgi:hypothetical protein
LHLLLFLIISYLFVVSEYNLGKIALLLQNQKMCIENWQIRQVNIKKWKCHIHQSVMTTFIS